MEKRSHLPMILMLAWLSAVCLQGWGQSMVVHTKSAGNIRFETSEVDSISFGSHATGTFLDAAQMSKPYFLPAASLINWRYGDVQMVCHRAYCGFPENTYVGIAKAVEAGYKMIECDIAFTKDSIAILSHDATLDRCTDTTGYTTDYTLEEMR